jgi:SAM-dependent methyltransferase
LGAAGKRSPARLHLGCGGNILSGWLNADIVPEADVYIDATKVLPFQDGALAAIYAEELIEHLSLDQGVRLLKECCRCLRPGGSIRLTTPDLGFLLSFPAMTAAHLEALRLDMETFGRDRRLFPVTLVSEYVNDAFFLHSHRFLYDYRTLRECLTLAGFTDVRQESYGQSSRPELKGLDSHLSRYPAPEAGTLFVEAVRPAGALPTGRRTEG